MKKLLRPGLILVALLSLNACTEEDPIEPNVDPREKFIGTWNVQEKIGGQVTGAYQSTITNDAGNTARISIGNIYNLGAATSVKALIAGNSIDISAQVVTGITIEGTGLYAGDGFTLNFTANDGTGAENVEAIYTK
ncbi:MAG: hypothetical protein R2850_03945 [Bacteroidia bacterium]